MSIKWGTGLYNLLAIVFGRELSILKLFDLHKFDCYKTPVLNIGP